MKRLESVSECNSTILSYHHAIEGTHLQNGLTEGQICGFLEYADDGECFKDSSLQDDRKLTTVVGIASFGISCELGFPIVYTSVAHYLDWIESIVWPNSKTI